MNSQSIREAFTQFFTERGHTPEKRSSLVPHNDPTLLFVNAGMVQFKDVFLGQDPRSYTRATTVQPCVRAGGKHNDLDNVGYTARHHTFFEMLGNFSFGDYFKQEAIEFAWTFLTEVVKLPKEKLWITVFEEDHEAEEIWLKKIGVDPERLSRIGAKDNFWQMGDTGPCGPCTEIFYDHGEDIAGGPPGTPEEDGDRYIEIWNLVFMQYDRDADGNLNPLPKPSVDTGMGLERLAAILQGVHDNYDIDTFTHLIKAAAKIIGTDDLTAKSLRVVADHIRSTSFLIVDGVMPSNEGRGYVLRRIIRRAIRHGSSLGATGVFFYKLVDALIESMGQAYPELAANRDLICDALKKEENQFLKTLEHGLKLFEQAISKLDGSEIPGESVFKLYDTYGFPVDLTQDLARERDLTLDMAGFDKAMSAQKERARAGSDFKQVYKAPTGCDHESSFLGYTEDQAVAKLEAIYVDGQEVESLTEGANAQLVLNESPFYAESGGQAGDTGIIKTDSAVFVVEDTQKHANAIVHIGLLKSGGLNKGDQVNAEVDASLRDKTRLNHSATHLLHAALREVLGDHVQQKGSLVDPDKLRFDFSHSSALTRDETKAIEGLVNAQIRSNNEVKTIETDMDSAKDLGAMMLFGEKYGESVRVLKMGNFSVELCGGTHASRTGDIGLLKIVTESGVAAGVRRIEAITGQAAFDYLDENTDQLFSIAAKLKTPANNVAEKVAELSSKLKVQAKEIRELQVKAQAAEGSDLADGAEDMGDFKLMVKELSGADPKALRDIVDDLKKKLGTAVIVLGIKGNNKVSLICGVTDNLTDRFKAGQIINHVASQVGGKGGGRADMAQAGGSEPEHLDKAMASVKSFFDK